MHGKVIGLTKRVAFANLANLLLPASLWALQHLLRHIHRAFIFAMSLIWCTIQFRSTEAQQYPTANRMSARNAFGGCIVKAVQLLPHSKPQQDQKRDDFDFGTGVDREIVFRC
jgi:hypothetical protein